MSPAPVRSAPRRALLVALLTLFALALVQAPAQAAPGQQVGIQAHLLWSNVSVKEMNRQLDVASQAGAQVLRVDVGWSSLEQDGKGRWNAWYRGRLDTLVAEAERRNIKLLLTLTDSPCWASTAPESLKRGCAGVWWGRGVEKYTPVNPGDYADALAALVRRYGSRVSAWEIWNEPNSPDYYKTPNAARDYVALVKVAYRAAKAADPRSTIVAGSVMESDYRFTEKLYQAGIKGYFDAFSIHPYCLDLSPLSNLDSWMSLSFIQGVPKVREVMQRYGDSRPMWLTEFGWSTSTTRDTSNLSNNGVDEARQARYVKDAIDQVSRWSYVKGIIYYNLVNTLDDRASLYGNYGLTRRDGSVKPALTAFRSAARAFAAPTVKRVRGGVRVTGASAPGARVRVTLFRARQARTSLRRNARVNAAGRFALVVRDSRLRRGSWLAAHRRV